MKAPQGKHVAGIAIRCSNLIVSRTIVVVLLVQVATTAGETIDGFDGIATRHRPFTTQGIMQRLIVLLKCD